MMNTQTESDIRIRAMEFVRLRYTAAQEMGLDVNRDHVMSYTVNLLTTLFAVSQRRAETIAAQVIGEYESARARVSIDIDRSTAHVVFVRDGSTERAVTAKQLLAFLNGQPRPEILYGTA